MLSRRSFLLSASAMGALALPACTPPLQPLPPPSGLPYVSIDIHAHIFNATDIPIPGFLDQVFLRSPESPVGGNFAPRALIRLVTKILLLAVSTADEERDRLPQPAKSAAALVAQDKAILAQGVRNYAAIGQATLRANDVRLSVDVSEGAQLLGELNRLANRGVFLQRSSADLGLAVADAVFDEPSLPVVALRSTGGGGDPSLAQTLRWAVLLTRDRRDILDTLIGYYGLSAGEQDDKSRGISAFSPSLVDFEYWFTEKAQARMSSQQDQIDVMSRLALLERRTVLLNFAPFCPLRAAIDGDGVHRRIRKAILTQGFVGVKIYPPMGFKPIGNSSNQRLMGGFRKAPGAGIDRELRKMYRWCNDNGVPIKSHGNNSLAAGECSGQNAAPDLWARVLHDYRDLRVNIAHFGGFEEITSSDVCADPPPYEKRAAELIAEYPNAYVDLGYWNEVVGTSRPGTEILEEVRALVEQTPELAERIMYGSDYTMIGKEKQYNAYLRDVAAAIDSINGLSRDAIFALNPQRYLGLNDPNNPTRQRLDAFFPSDHPYHSLF
ncbi:hypothetical protein EBB79_08060 [Parasedimentitalea marina]|uniref:Amidohydrolase-related domain-containing protein n=1 Tax=Parasedimentitalea marina TaxID=2483033 RepID=A0A3T0N1J0_9RHOB|nr:amidohydrolase family protein [Parasedimentitalea marina]AZV77852.1 hypothetical protein EBB79_08060 [Parasedimentitalea marina]